MIAYSLSKILQLVPEAKDFVKQANLQMPLPLDNKDGCIASALAVTYLSEVNPDPSQLSPYAIEKVAEAVSLYGVTDTTKSLSDLLVKRASDADKSEALNTEAKKDWTVKQAHFTSFAQTMDRVEDRVSEAESLVKRAESLNQESSEDVLRYAAKLPMDKQAALNGLHARYHATEDVRFAKLASAVSSMPDVGYKQETVRDLCKTVTALDKEANLQTLGFDFYKEALIEKSAARSCLPIKLAGTSVPYEKIERLGKHNISRYIGDDVAAEFDKGPQSVKIAMETLPLDLQRLVVNLTKN